MKVKCAFLYDSKYPDPGPKAKKKHNKNLFPSFFFVLPKDFIKTEIFAAFVSFWGITKKSKNLYLLSYIDVNMHKTNFTNSSIYVPDLYY